MSFEYLKQKRILLVDDETELLHMVEAILKKDGYTQIRTAGSVSEAWTLYEEWKPEFAVLDVMLPDGDGFSLLSRIREKSDIPVLFLTARGEDEDRFKGWDMGADDYIVKPFMPRELTSRLLAILRRSYKSENPLAVLSGSRVDFERAEVIRDGVHIPLTAKEYDILTALYRNAGRIVTIDQLCEAAWGDNPFGYENSLMAHIRRIREKIEKNPSKPVSLLTVKGLGYKLLMEDPL